MANVSSINPHLQSLKCPAPLRALPAWVVWRYETLPGETKPRKTPWYVDGSKRWGRQGTPEDRARLVTFELARLHAARRGFDGVGFCPMPEFNVVALDFDDCVVDGKILPEIEQMLVGTYSEFSPSGRGVRAFYRGNLSNRKSHARKGWPYGFETFSSKGFITVTGNLTPDCDLIGCDDILAELSPGVLALYDLRFKQERERQERETLPSSQPVVGLTERQMRQALDVLDPGCDYDDWLDVGMGLHHETSGSDLGLALWNAWSADWADYPGEDLLAAKWDSFGRREGGRQVTFRSVIRRANELGAGINLSQASLDDFEAIEEGAASDGDDDFQVIEGGEEQEKKRFELVSPVDFTNRPDPVWILEGVLPRAELAVLFGEPGSGKSFIALDLALSIALGKPWRGIPVVRCRVVYVVAEGAGFFGLRLKAYCKHHQVDMAELAQWFRLVDGAPNLLERQDALELTKRIVEWGQVGVVVMDTFARVTPGANENSGEDMGKALGHCKGLHKRTHALVMLVHHSGKDASKGARGWSGIKGAADTQLECRKTPAGHLLDVDKQKDGDDTLQWGFALDVVQVGQNLKTLTPITSCVVRELDALPVQQAAAARRKLKANEQLIADTVHAILELQGGTSVALEEVIERVLAEHPYTGTSKRDNRRQHLKDAAETLTRPDADGLTGSYRLEEGRIHVS